MSTLGLSGDTSGRASTQELVEDLRQSAAPDLYDSKTYIPWPTIEQDLEGLLPGVTRLQSLVDNHALTAPELRRALRYPRVLQVINTLLVSAKGVGFADGRSLPVRPPRDEQQLDQLAHLLLDLGLHRILEPGTSVASLARVGLIAADTRRRGFRRRDLIASQVRDLLENSLERVADGLDINLAQSTVRVPARVRGRVERVIVQDDRLIAAVVTGFYSQSGGRQQRELSFGYPELQRLLNDEGLPLIAIVDGAFVKDAPMYVLARLVSGVAHAMTVQQASSGKLDEAITKSVYEADQGTRLPRAESLLPLVNAALSAGQEVIASDLPTDIDQARLALSSYVSQHPDEDLLLEPDGLTLRWRRPETVSDTAKLANEFDPHRAITLLRNLLNATPDVTQDVVSKDGTAILAGLVELPEDRVLPTNLLIAASAQSASTEDIRAVARTARRLSADASLATLIVPETSAAGGLSNQQLQRSLATSVVILSPADLAVIAASKQPRDSYVHFVLEQADLSKANPFNPTGATRRRMFFGREEEEADLLATLDNSSVALLGGRRIGKTSLLQRSVDTLAVEGWASYYADCQSVGDWDSFVGHISARWAIELPREFRTEHLRSLVDQLAARHEGRLVLALDEIDYLLRWDQTAHGPNVPEAFFRACRALSQEGVTRFIFSGERLIGDRMWDPSSPHYNFCRPLSVQQLSQRASAALINQPLAALGIVMDDVSAATALTWKYTSGHPHLLQLLGERIVSRVNQEPPSERGVFEHSNIPLLAETADYRQHYVETYWGQATKLERLITLLMVTGADTMDEIRARLEDLEIACDADGLARAFRMLTLYGVLDSTETPLRFRAQWFRDASTVLGDAETVIDDLRETMAS